MRRATTAVNGAIANAATTEVTIVSKGKFMRVASIIKSKAGTLFNYQNSMKIPAVVQHTCKLMRHVFLRDTQPQIPCQTGQGLAFAMERQTAMNRKPADFIPLSRA
jgi:hypothetical protein